MKKYLLTVFFLLIIQLFLPAQTAMEIEELLNTRAVSNEQAARFVLKAADVLNTSDPEGFFSPADAFNFAADRKWLPKDTESGAESSLEGISLLLMQSFGMKGGLFYSLFSNPHYAYRELVYRDIIQGKTDPEMTVSGEMLLFLIGRVFTITEEDLAASPAKKAEEEAYVQEITTQLQAQDLTDTSVRRTDEGVTISLFNIQFLANSAELPDKEKSELRKIANILNNIPARRILVSGHTAMAGTAQDRLMTSTERARAVKDYLVQLGTRNENEIAVRGFGAERPIADNGTPEGMARNRRVEITILENQR